MQLNYHLMSVVQPMLRHLGAYSKTLRATVTRQNIKGLLEQPEKVFATLALLSGFIMVLLMPLFMVPDETVHFYRAYQVGEGRIVGTNANEKIGGSVPILPAMGTENKGEPTDLPFYAHLPARGERFEMFPSTALYSPVGYVPQAAGVDVARILGAPLNIMVLLGRLCNLIMYVILVFLAIKIAKQGKWVYVAAGLLPLSIQEAASLSPDVMNVGLAFLTIAVIHGLFFQTSKVTHRQFLLLLLLAAGLGLTKQTNFLLLLPIVFVPGRLFASLRQRIGFIIGTLGMGFVMMLAWYVTIKLVYNDLNYATAIGLQGVNQLDQLKYVLGHPLAFVATLFRTFVFEGFRGIPTGDFLWTSMYGYFSWFTYKLPLSFIMLGYAMLFITLLHRPPSEEITTEPQRSQLPVVFSAVFVLSLIAVASVLYLVWTVVGAPQIAGVQGRYVIPLLPLLIPLFRYIGKYIIVTFDKPYRLGMCVSVVSVVNAGAMMILTFRWFY
jgi:uncharacterized membrane protein